MSLPPLVCNTPPPPDQCEDDKDPEDFDLNYNLSQDDEDSNGYDFQTYPNYDVYEPSKSETLHESHWPPTLTNPFENILTDNLNEVIKETEHVTPILNVLSEKLTLDDVTVEDLNLEISQDHLNTQMHLENEIEKKDPDITSCEFTENTVHKAIKETDIVATDFNIIHDESICSLDTSDNPSQVNNENFNSKSQEFNGSIFHEINSKDSKKSENCDSPAKATFEKVSESSFDEEIENLGNKDQTIDEIGDFDEFQFVSNNDNTEYYVETIENPWVDEPQTSAVQVGEFKANFDENYEESSNIDNQMIKNDSIDDDFGDFDDFKSCAKQSSQEEKDRINNMLSSIYNEEISEPESEFVGKLESVLNETWGHLVDIDARQPYMVNWNNSVGQKSLLKALCIDSRNILFGPKWNYSMPKYAVNLSAAPLQPQKPITSPVPQADIQYSQKSAVKETDTWSDPFSSNGEESCSNENETTTSERRTNDLEVFEKVMPPKIDSETPRSKTIHYDSSPPVMLTQTVVNNENVDSIARPQSPITEGVNNMENNNDYWEFQDFKSTAESVKPSADKHAMEPVTELEKKSEKENSVMPSCTIPYQQNLLQPIKVETVMPTLNWPEPGEVKDSFDDFSDFVSSAPWETAEKNVKADLQESKINTTELDKSNDTTNNRFSINVAENNDDEFETFQSAPIVPQYNSKSRKNSNTEITYQPSTSKTTDFDTSFSDFSKYNRGEITPANSTIFKNNLSNAPNIHVANVSSVTDGFVTNSPIHSMEMPSILQPLPASSSGVSRVQNNSGQILQPLSLESYSQINWPNPGIDLQDLSRFNPVETLPSLKSEPSAYSQNKVSSPAHTESTSTRNEIQDDDIWGDFVSSKPKQQIPATKKPPTFGDEDEWTEFVSSPNVKPQNGLNTISLNVHTNLSMQKSTNLNKLNKKNNQISLDIPTLNYITPKTNRKTYNDKHFQNL
ncbi:unnamed protein product, partial [Iphiclides podalirius]